MSTYIIVCRPFMIDVFPEYISYSNLVYRLAKEEQ